MFLIRLIAGENKLADSLLDWFQKPGDLKSDLGSELVKEVTGGVLSEDIQALARKAAHFALVSNCSPYVCVCMIAFVTYAAGRQLTFQRLSSCACP